MFARVLILANSIALLFVAAASAQEEKSKWQYTPDALEKPIKILNEPWTLFTPKKFNEFSGKTFVFAMTPSPYLVMLTGGGGPQRLDLANRKILPPLNVEKHLFANLSPDGKYYAVMDESKDKVRVWSFQTGKQVMSYEVNAGEGLEVELDVVLDVVVTEAGGIATTGDVVLKVGEEDAITGLIIVAGAVEGAATDVPDDYSSR